MGWFAVAYCCAQEREVLCRQVFREEVKIDICLIIESRIESLGAKHNEEKDRHMSAIKWVESWLQGRQRDSNNQCSFCNAGEHDARNC
jgi:hypothetical protein